MSDQDLAKKIASLEAIEAIKATKHKYFRALDQELFAEVSQCFSSDGVIDYGPAGVYEQVSDFVAMISDYAKTNTAKGIHQAYNPEISVDGDTATAKWVCSYCSVDVSKAVSFKQTGVYEDEFVKIDGKWLIKRTSNRAIFNETTVIDGDTVSVTLG